MEKKKGMSLLDKQSRAGWIFLAPATLMIAVMSFWPMFSAFLTSLKTGSSAKMEWASPIITIPECLRISCFCAP